MSLPSQDIVDMLEAEGSTLGLTFKGNLFVGREPDAPANCVTIYDTPGNKPDSTLDKNSTWRPAVQIKVRNRSYADAGDLINSIKEVLHLRSGETWNGTRYLLIECSQEPFCLGYDENSLAMWICNFDLQRQ